MAITGKNFWETTQKNKENRIPYLAQALPLMPYLTLGQFVRVLMLFMILISVMKLDLQLNKELNIFSQPYSKINFILVQK